MQALPMPSHSMPGEYSAPSEYSLAPYSTSTSNPDLIGKLLEDKRSADTRRAYAADLRDFFCYVDKDRELSPELVHKFITSSTRDIALCITGYKSHLIQKQLSEATINRRLAAIRSLLKLAHRLGYCETDGRGLVDGEKARAYRDTRGVDVKTLKKLLASPARLHGDSLRTHRDKAILTLLIENALRRAELCKLNVEDFDATGKSLWILGKGRGSQKERVTLSERCVTATLLYLRAAGHGEAAHNEGPLFRNLDRRPAYSKTHLSADGLYYLVGEYGRAVGLKRLTPHMLRHSAITALSNATNGNLVKIQGFSRHAKIETVRRYVDNASDMQGEMTNVLSRLL